MTIKSKKAFSSKPKNNYSSSLMKLLLLHDNGTTSGAVEGINNKLKLIKRSGYGFRNFDNFRVRCLLNWHFNC